MSIYAFLAAILLLGTSDQPAAGTGRASGPGGRPAGGPASQPASAPASQPVELRIIAQGQLFNHIGGGVEGTKVVATSKAGGAVLAEAVTDALGDFTLKASAAPRGAVVITVSREFFQTQTLELESIDPADPPFVDLEMRGAITLRGQVRDGLRDQPVSGARIVLESGQREWKTTSDAEGAFVLEGLLPGRGALRVDADGFARHRGLVPQVETGGPLDIRLLPERIVTLRVVDQAGQPVGGVNVECLERDTRDYRHVVTGTNGLATVRGLNAAARQLLLRLSHEQYVSTADFERTIELPADQAESTHELVMQRAGRIAGRVLSADTDDPLNGARLSVGEVLSDGSPHGWSNMRGEYQIDGVPPGPAVLTVHLAGHAPELLKLTVEADGTATQDVRLGPATTLRGTVVDAAGKPVSGAHITATRWREQATLGLRARSNEAGEFELSNVPGDAFEVAVYLPGCAPLLDQTVAVNLPEPRFVLQAGAPEESAEGAGPKKGDAAPEFKLRTLKGDTLVLSELRGKVVLLDFWATWCGPCVGEVPTLVELHRTCGPRPDFVMASVSLDDDLARLGKFVEAQKMAWPQVAGPSSGAPEAVKAYAVAAIPRTVLIDREGRVLAVDLRGKALIAAVTESLGSASK